MVDTESICNKLWVGAFGSMTLPAYGDEDGEDG